MPGVIKGRIGSYVYVNNFDTDEPVMKTVYGKSPAETDGRLSKIIQLNDRNQKAREAVEKLLVDEAPPDAESAGQTDDDENATVSSEEARVGREKLIAEYEAIKSKYEKESEEFVLRAREKATEIYEKTKEMATRTIQEAKTEADKIRAQAEQDAKTAAEEARSQGHAEGEKKGYDEGYVKALKKCKDTLIELKSLAEQVTADKTEVMMQYEHQLFDTIFDIAQRVTLGALGQKEKGVITRMIREAGKKYRASKNVKLTLSKLDVSEEADIDEQLLTDVFRGCDNVEIEILEDAPAGTLMIDDGAEITDASVMTQLKMVEQLGKGKYRDKNLTDMLQDQAAQKSKRGRKKAQDPSAAGTDEASDAADNEQELESAVPDVVYKTKAEILADEEDELEKAIRNS